VSLVKNQNVMMAIAVASALAAPNARAQTRARPAPRPAAVGAASASAEDVRALREQMQALAERLGRLEEANRQLESQNAELKAQAGQASETQQAVQQVQADLDATVDQLAKTRANAPEWAGRWAFRGDLRYRHEEIRAGADRQFVVGAQPVVSSVDRARDRVRLRFGGTFRANDTVVVGLQLATGGNDPRSTNQTLGENSPDERRQLGIDQAFVAWQPNGTWLVRGGKMPMPWSRPTGSLFFDNDIDPEGLAVNYTQGLFFGSASYMWLQERGPTQVAVGTGAVDVADPAMGHAQVGIRYPFTALTSLTAAVAYFDHFAVKNRQPWFNGLPNGNSTVPQVFPAGSTTTRQVAAYDYDTLQAFAQLDSTVFDTLPLSVYAEYAKNEHAPRLNTAWGYGFSLGRASNPHTWEVGALYQKMGKDAMFGQWVDSDFGNGNTDTKGWVLRAGYAVKQNWTLNATMFLNELNNEVFSATAPRNRRYDRLQLDTNFRF
jgi:hypothetical protein